MSCTVTEVLGKDMTKHIDDGVDVLAAKITAALKKDHDGNSDCRASDIDKWVNIVNMAIQYIILSFIVLAVINRENVSLIANVITWVSYVSLILIAIQYRNVTITAGRLFMYGLDLETRVIIAFSVAIAIMTTMIQNGTTGLTLLVIVGIMLFIRLAIQMKDFLLDRESKIPAFLVFIKELLTPSRIKKIYNAF